MKNEFKSMYKLNGILLACLDSFAQNFGRFTVEILFLTLSYSAKEIVNQVLFYMKSINSTVT